MVITPKREVRTATTTVVLGAPNALTVLDQALPNLAAFPTQSRLTPHWTSHGALRDPSSPLPRRVRNRDNACPLGDGAFHLTPAPLNQPAVWLRLVVFMVISYRNVLRS